MVRGKKGQRQRKEVEEKAREVNGDDKREM